MNYNQIYAIALQGLNLEKLRVDIVANNIANQHTIKDLHHPLFQPLSVLATAKPFNAYLNDLDPVESINLIPQQLPPNKIYQPSHPGADEQGYVTYPGLSAIDEMTTLLQAARAYEANLRIMNTAHTMYLKALTIGEER